MAVNFTTLFTRLGHFLYIGEELQSALGSVSPTRINAALTGLGSSLPVEYEAVRDQMLTGMISLQGSGTNANGNLVATAVEQLILLTVQDDNPLISTLDDAVAELIRQMITATESLDASAVGSSLSYGSGNVGTGKALISMKRPDGKSCLFAFAETIELLCSNIAGGSPSFTVSGEPSIVPLSPAWPGGSAAATTMSSRSADANNLVPNGTFETADDQEANLPSDWLAPVATFGTRLKLSSVEVQTVVIAGTPTAGYYRLSWVNALSQTQTTAPLAFNASEGDVQTALRALVGLENVDVVTTGTTPNYTHTITFTGVTNPAQLTSTDSTTGGTHSITHGTSTAGSANVFRGARSVELASNATELTTLMVPVSLDALTQYAVNLWIKSSAAAPAAGVLTIDLVDGVGGTVLNDASSVANSFTFGHAAFTTSFQAVNGVFRTPAVMPPQTYLRIRISTAITNAVSLYLDEVWMGPMVEAYTDGPSFAIFDGATAWALNDLITATITNDRAGLMHEWLDRVLGLRDARLQFPTVTDGSETQADSLVA